MCSPSKLGAVSSPKEDQKRIDPTTSKAKSFDEIGMKEIISFRVCYTNDTISRLTLAHMHALASSRLLIIPAAQRVLREPLIEPHSEDGTPTYP